MSWALWPLMTTPAELEADGEELAELEQAAVPANAIVRIAAPAV